MLFFRRGKSGTYFVPTIANPDAPSLAAVEAGTELSAAIASISGFETQLNRINQAVQKYPVELQIAGPQQFQDATMELLEDDGSGVDADGTARQEARTVLVEGASGYLVMHPTKATDFEVADEVEVWPVSVGAVNRSWSLDTQAARYTVNFTVTGPPIKDAVLAA